MAFVPQKFSPFDLPHSSQKVDGVLTRRCQKIGKEGFRSVEEYDSVPKGSPKNGDTADANLSRMVRPMYSKPLTGGSQAIFKVWVDSG